MDRLRFVFHEAQKILILDFSHCTPEEAIQLMERAKPVFEKQPAGSVRALDIVTDAHYDLKTVQALKEFTVHNKPYVKAVAVVGVGDLMKIVFNGVQKYSKRSFTLFNNVEQAKDWLAAQ